MDNLIRHSGKDKTKTEEALQFGMKKTSKRKWEYTEIPELNQNMKEKLEKVLIEKIINNLESKIKKSINEKK